MQSTLPKAAQGSEAVGSQLGGLDRRFVLAIERISDLFVIQLPAERSRHRDKGLAEELAVEIIGTRCHRSVSDSQPFAIAGPQFIIGRRHPDGVAYKPQLTEVHITQRSTAEQGVGEIEEDRMDRLLAGPRADQRPTPSSWCAFCHLVDGYAAWYYQRCLGITIPSD